MHTDRDGQSVEYVHARMRTAILRAELSPGDELSQVRLANELGVSRTPLREALRMLVNEGLLEGEPNRQLRVAGYSMADMEEVYVARVSLETTALRITIPSLTTRDIAQMEGLLAQMGHYAGEADYDNWEVPHRALHHALHAHAGRRVIAILTQLSEYAGRYRRAYSMQADRAWVTAQGEHRSIVDACRARDADTGARLLAEHLGHTAIGLIDMLDPGYAADALRTAIAAAGAPVDRSAP